jgi:hypothetical protein
MSLFDQDDEYKPADDKSRLFETHERNRRSFSSYLKLFLVVAVFIIAAGFAIGYLMMPGVGDVVKSPDGLDDAVMSHFTDVVKRSVNDATTYKCDGFHWVRVEVEPRPDIPGDPLNRIGKFRARATPRDGGGWEITVLPVMNKDDDVPCRF